MANEAEANALALIAMANDPEGTKKRLAELVAEREASEAATREREAMWKKAVDERAALAEERRNFDNLKLGWHAQRRKEEAEYLERLSALQDKEAIYRRDRADVDAREVAQRQRHDEQEQRARDLENRQAALEREKAEVAALKADLERRLANVRAAAA